MGRLSDGGKIKRKQVPEMMNRIRRLTGIPEFVITLIAIIGAITLGFTNPTTQDGVLNILSLSIGGYWGHIVPRNNDNKRSE